MRLRCILTMTALAAGLSACGSAENLRQSVGLSVPPPDEYLVVARAPLSMPPDLATLPVPQPGARSLVDPDPQAQARAALAGAPVARAAAPSTGEQSLVAAVGPAEPGIRQTVRAEETARPATRRFGLDSFLGFQINQTPGRPSDAIDAEEEAERLRRAGLPAPILPPPLPEQ